MRFVCLVFAAMMTNGWHGYVGTEHLLLGALKQQQGIAASALQNANIKYDDVRKAILELLGQTIDPTDTQTSSGNATESTPPQPEKKKPWWRFWRWR